MPRRYGAVHLGVASVAVGVAAGLAGVALTEVLHAVQHLAFGYTEATFLTGVERADGRRRVLALAVGGGLVGVGWWLHRRWLHGNVSVTRALAEPEPRLPLVATTTDALLQIVAVGTGGSLGREGAPRQVGAALAAVIARHTRLRPGRRGVLVAAGAGAGLAAVYNVPFGGAVFALEVLLAGRRRTGLLPVIVASVVATVIAWPFLGRGSTYALPGAHVTAAAWLAVLVLGPAGALAGLGFRSAMTLARTHAPGGWRAVLTVPVAFTALGALAIAYPQLLGNGKNLAELALTGSLTAGLAAALTALKPAATAVCLGSGAIGGLLTPSFATGAALGALVGHGTHQTEYALLGAATVLAVAQRAPWTAIVLTLEFTHVPIGFALPVAAAVGLARLVEVALVRGAAHQRGCGLPPDRVGAGHESIAWRAAHRPRPRPARRVPERPSGRGDCLGPAGSAGRAGPPRHRDR